ncbi:MAG TPA: hypothetical protein VGK94_15530 [Candidatus Polarisedimenticolia bacterium]|jgi:hypothetical protein
MKHRIIGLVLLAVSLSILSVLTASGEPKGEQVTVKGEVVDLWCYLEDGSHGPEHKACTTECAKAGNPIGIVDDKGNIYVVMGMKDHRAGRDVLADKMAQTVTVTGTLVKKGGTQVLYVTSFE